MAEVLQLDDNGRSTLGAVDGSTSGIMQILGDATSGSHRVNLWVYNPTSLAWERMVQPVINASGDFTVTMGDVEALLAESYWKVKQYDWTSGDLDYAGYNIVATAADAATTWYVFKYTWAGSNCTKIQGPAIGSWTGRAGLF